jgi:hypothetical protein
MANFLHGVIDRLGDCLGIRLSYSLPHFAHDPASTLEYFLLFDIRQIPGTHQSPHDLAMNRQLNALAVRGKTLHKGSNIVWRRFEIDSFHADLTLSAHWRLE